jgi:hypothetical protein
MIRRNTWVLLGVFIIVAAGAFFFQRMQQKKAEAQPTATPAYTTLIDFGTHKILRVSINDDTGRSIILTQDSQGNYTPSPEEYSHLNADTVSNAMVEIRGLNVLNSLETVPALNVIGLEKPHYTIHITLDDGAGYVLQIGDKTPTGTGYYVSVDGKSPVVVDGTGLSAIIDLLTPPTPTPSPTGGTPSPTTSSATGTTATNSPDKPVGTTPATTPVASDTPTPQSGG